MTPERSTALVERRLREIGQGAGRCQRDSTQRPGERRAELRSHFCQWSYRGIEAVGVCSGDFLSTSPPPEKAATCQHKQHPRQSHSWNGNGRGLRLQIKPLQKRTPHACGAVSHVCCDVSAPRESCVGGSLEATRRSFNKDFLLALAADFKKHGAAAIEKVRKQQPDGVHEDLRPARAARDEGRAQQSAQGPDGRAALP
jgi:hypothetical protein